MRSFLTAFTPVACALLAIGSIILVLAWIFFDFFAGMTVVNLYAWLPLLVLLGVVALLMTKQWERWTTTALAIPTVIFFLYGLYYPLMLIGLIAWIPASIIIPTVIILLILLNGSAFWFTRRLLKAGRADKQKNENVHLKKRSFLKLLPKTTLSLAIGALFIKTYIWDDPSKQWLLSDLFPNENTTNKLTLASSSGNLLYDASHLNSSIVAEIRSPKIVAEIIQAISDAKSTNKKISLSGVRHSMGGQALGSNTLHLDMTDMDSVRYNDSDQTVTVGAGATWKQVQQALSPHGRAVRVMQDSNIFSVGGSLSVNCHGKDPQYRSLIEGVNYLKMVTADGQEILYDKTTNKDLFSSVIGSYGLLGIITEANLRTTQNSTFAFSMFPVQTHLVIDTLESLSKNPANRLVEAHFSVDAEHFLSESLIYKYSEAPSLQKPKDELNGENSVWLRKVVFQASRMSNFGKAFRWTMEKHISPLVEPKTLTRNTAMAVPVRFLQNPDPHSTDILQEYFIPTEQANTFLEGYKKLLKKYNVDLLNITLRKVSKDTNALVSYAQQDMYGFVVYYKVYQNSRSIQTINAFTSELVDYLISIKATYYLCYGSYYSQSQLITMYPDICKLFALKTRIDPDTLFTNIWYEKYREQAVKQLTLS